MFASFTAVRSFFMSTTKITSGATVNETNPPNCLSSLAISLSTNNLSFFVKPFKAPISLSDFSFFNLLILVFICCQLVIVPPNHLSITNGKPTLAVSCLTISLACLFVPTKATVLPSLTNLVSALHASLKQSTVFSKSNMCTPPRLPYKNFSILGFQRLDTWPK